ncbi:hypothetical protein Dsin_003705 [Dipteronia sinensis]|uniref:DUF4283 domain-containing protein n=1 Tax=Dipteronia sinensis TaxID=43782 RepID=A0AAE0B9F3_9ROSI|nr:hypothetical protein Dsin_003705 [Dipteronia sinensis]
MTEVGRRGWDARQRGKKREDGVDYRRRGRSARSHVGHSYAEVVKSVREYRPYLEKNPKQHSFTKSMFWYRSSEDEAWLSKSAIGWLKDFGSFEPVNMKLESRGCAFSTAYLGGKGTVWTFDSEWDRDGFINNEFLWRDYFVSMSNWNEEFALSTSLKWIDVYGVPLNCWSISFFKELGNHVGELVWIDEDTRSRCRASNKRESSGEDYSSSENGPNDMVFFGPKFLKGECSMHRQAGHMIKPMNNANPGSITESEPMSLGQVGPLGNYMGQEERPDVPMCSSGGNRNQMEIHKSDAVLTNEGRREKGIKLYVDLRNQDSESNNHRSGEEDIEADGVTIDNTADYSQKRLDNGVVLVRTEQDVRADRGESGLPKNKKDRSRGLDSNLKTHPMTTRRSKVITQSGQMETRALASKGEQNGI